MITLSAPFYADLLDFPLGVHAIAHGCNCQNVMGAGLAKNIRKRYPAAWEADCKAAKNKLNQLGSLSFATIPDDKFIFNLYVQERYGTTGRFVNYEALYTALEEMLDTLNFKQDMYERTIKVGFPYHMCCGLAGGSWQIVYHMICDVFDKYSSDVYIFNKI
jgi:O-acetyl-ADP-ribose deacetylase (regulator of RNase III)